MSIEKKYPKEIKQILSKYPPEYKRSAVMPLLHLVQKDEGFIVKKPCEILQIFLKLQKPKLVQWLGFIRCIKRKKRVNIECKSAPIYLVPYAVRMNF